ncbi:putative adenylyl cyclase CyaB [Methanoregula boonei 6A8]|jgi:adenylate cyclase class 2|uniref:Putative adenylyl cyclase CyaB n=1 Tax=Methanoregula boonei (strain DSM 21154 / JCM 14090 / 6A8) TaxID=456442 RepID=A7I7Y3_METB6|nr:class IV adenylate cyclase [Methanoregula boonei]ABS55844.1 putative adenylyl cyclase CyaB [Methanoregula boonei 6A8]
MLEIELKVRVDALDPLRKNLLARHAEFTGKQHEHDIYYNAPHRDFGTTDEALRVRYTDGPALVTYKGKKIPELNLKAREELNTCVESGEVFETILNRLGFTKTAEVNKWRENYRLGNASFALDTVEGLGTFAEIEIMAENNGEAATAEIMKLAKELGIGGEPILASYLELLLSTR